MIINSIIAGAGGGGIEIQSYTATANYTNTQQINENIVLPLLGNHTFIYIWYDGDASLSGYNNQFVQAYRALNPSTSQFIRYRDGSIGTVAVGTSYDGVVRNGQSFKYIVFDK